MILILFTALHHQEISTHHKNLKSLVSDQWIETWDLFPSWFMQILEELRSYVELVSDDKKYNWLLRKLPEAYMPI